MRKAIAPMMSSGSWGTSGFEGGSTGAAARYFTVRLLSVRTSLLPSYAPGRSGVVEDERDHDPDQRQRLGQREPDVHVGLDQPTRFRLPGHGLNPGAEDQADADARADGRQAVGHRPD